MTRAVNDATIALIKEFEGCKLEIYQDSRGLDTIGIGHLIKDGEDFSASITEEQANDLLQQDLADACDAVASHISVDLTDNEYGALVSLVFNVGTAPLTGGLADVLNGGDYRGAMNHILLYNKERINGELVVSDGLKRRRIAEATLFIKPDA